MLAFNLVNKCLPPFLIGQPVHRSTIKRLSPAQVTHTRQAVRLSQVTPSLSPPPQKKKKKKTHTHTKRLPKLLPNHPTPAQASGQVAPTSPPPRCGPKSPTPPYPCPGVCLKLVNCYLSAMGQGKPLWHMGTLTLWVSGLTCQSCILKTTFARIWPVRIRKPRHPD